MIGRSRPRDLNSDATDGSGGEIRLVRYVRCGDRQRVGEATLTVDVRSAHFKEVGQATR